MNENSQEPSVPNDTENGQQLPTLSTLWCRHNAGDSLTAVQQQRLQTAFHHDPEFLQLVIDEQRVDQLLKMAAEAEGTGNAFVARVLQKCEATKSSPEAASMTLLRPAGDKFEISIVAATGIRGRSGRQPNRWVWLVLAVAMLLSFLGFTAWFRDEVFQLAWPVRNAEPRWLEPKSKSGNGGEPSQLPDLDSAIASQLNQLANQDGSPTGNLPEAGPESSIPGAIDKRILLATVTDVKDQSDDSPWQVGKTLGSEKLLLNSGEIQLILSSGVTVEVFAPSRLELTSENSLLLLSGELSATVPTGAHGFQVLTPGLMITDLGTVFDVAIGADGTTEVEVRQGSVAVRSRAQPTEQQWHLSADETHQLTFYSPNSIYSSPADKVDHNTPNPILAHDAIASLARQQSGPSTGVVSLNGRSLKIDDELVFAAVRDRVFRGVQESPEEFSSIWSQFVEATTQQPQPVGQITVNGVDFSFGNFNEAVKTQQRVLAQVHPELANQPGDPLRLENNPPMPGNFRGSLMINGQVREFESVEQYQAALIELVGPAARLGLFPFGN